MVDEVPRSRIRRRPDILRLERREAAGRGIERVLKECAILLYVGNVDRAVVGRWQHAVRFLAALVEAVHPLPGEACGIERKHVHRSRAVVAAEQEPAGPIGRQIRIAAVERDGLRRLRQARRVERHDGRVVAVFALAAGDIEHRQRWMRGDRVPREAEVHGAGEFERDAALDAALVVARGGPGPHHEQPLLRAARRVEREAAVGLGPDRDERHGLQARGQHRSEQENPRCLPTMIAHDFTPGKLWNARR